MGGHEDDTRGLRQLGDLNAVEAGHVDVEKRKRGLMSGNGRRGVETVGCNRDNVELRPCGAQPCGEILGQPWFIIGNDGAWACHGVTCCAGNRSSAMTPCAELENSDKQPLSP